MALPKRIIKETERLMAEPYDILYPFLTVTTLLTSLFFSWHKVFPASTRFLTRIICDTSMSLFTAQLSLHMKVNIFYLSLTPTLALLYSSMVTNLDPS